MPVLETLLLIPTYKLAFSKRGFRKITDRENKGISGISFFNHGVVVLVGPRIFYSWVCQPIIQSTNGPLLHTPCSFIVFHYPCPLWNPLSSSDRWTELILNHGNIIHQYQYLKFNFLVYYIFYHLISHYYSIQTKGIDQISFLIVDYCIFIAVAMLFTQTHALMSVAKLTHSLC